MYVTNDASWYKTLLVMTNVAASKSYSFQTVATLNNSLLQYITPNFSVSYVVDTVLDLMNLYL